MGTSSSMSDLFKAVWQVQLFDSIHTTRFDWFDFDPDLFIDEGL